MLVPELLLETLEGLFQKDFEKLRWYLSMEILKGCRPIPPSCLEQASRIDTVSRMIECYGEESAVNLTIAILRKAGLNRAAGELESKYAGGNPATPSTSSSAVAPPAAAPATLSAQQGSVIFAPTVTGGSPGTWNINISNTK